MFDSVHVRTKKIKAHTVAMGIEQKKESNDVAAMSLRHTCNNMNN